MINRLLSHYLMILVIIINSLSVIITLQLPQKMMAHTLPSEQGKVLMDDKAKEHSSIPNQLLLVLVVTVIITVMVARVQQAVAVTSL